ncbi:MAG TPA: N-acetyl-gamma-glutamyl-phosphate reductase, partial [Chthoniobacterales bacterium]|nr:N-acetyl-gamma-glutamyl-phosphate reductase [Chthoniobacterales bacterium]
RLLLNHPVAELIAVTSRQFAGKTLAEVFPRFAGRTKAGQLRFSDSKPEKISSAAEFIFLALPHGVSSGVAKVFLDKGLRVIDLSADFRLRDPAIYKEFYGDDHLAPELLKEAVYGLAERYRTQIADARLVACPGCYPTSILLPLLPLVREKVVLTNSIVINSLSGVSGAGRKVEADYLFAECNESARPYGIPKHRHLSEIEQALTAEAGEEVKVQFVPHLVPMNRGIISTMVMDVAADVDESEIEAVYKESYKKDPFVRLLGNSALPDTKNVAGTNFIDMSWRMDPRTDRLILTSAIDNLVKGTSGQAIQCLNLMCGYPETAGLW